MLVVIFVLQLATFYWIYIAVRAQSVGSIIAAVIATTIVAILWAGFFMVHPNQARVLQLFGAYTGTAREPGLRWANPFYTKQRVSTRVRNFESGKLKVNDLRGSPIEIAAVVVWKVVDTAEAVFEVDNYEEFVTIQSESALRNLTTTYPYEPHEGDDLGLRSDPVTISKALCKEIQDRLDKAGVTVLCSEEAAQPVLNTGSLYA